MKWNSVPIAAVAALFITACVAQAGPADTHWELTPFAGGSFFLDTLDYNNHGTILPLKTALYGGGRLGLQLNSTVGIELAGGYTPTKVDASGGQDVTWLHSAADVLVSGVHGDHGDVFLLAGGGFSQVKIKGRTSSFNQGTFDAGLGVRLWFSDNVALRLEGRNVLFLTTRSTMLGSNHSIVVAGAGLTFAIGGTPKDTDGDGVPDRKDKCPDTPKGATVDATGCPHDSDGDGVLDGLDKCPNTPKGASVDANGCPKDSDGDGVLDGLDKCPNTPRGATVDANGCPMDSDGDGVLDGLDKCPNTPKGAVVDASGCPMDSDGDGVPDGLDKCPNTPAGLKVDADGCPIEVSEKETELLDTGMIRLQNINFETAKADILPDSYATLNVVGTVLSKWPELKLEIGGHTDSRGAVKYNQKLSEARAQSVLNYVTHKFPGLKPEQFTVKGYGKSKPLVPNTNALNMAKNRRVEFVVLNRDVLKRESERRRLLKKAEAAPDSTRH